MFDRILVPLDGSELATCVLPYAVGVARALGSNITLLHVLERDDAPTGVVNPVDWQLQRMEAQSYLESLRARLGRATPHSPDLQMLEGTAAVSIIEYARNHKCGLLAMSSHGQSGLNGWNMSSVVQKVIDRARNSILLVRAYQQDSAFAEEHGEAFRFRRILVPLDGSQRAESILPIVTALAHFWDAELVFVHVVVRTELIQRLPLTAEDVLLLDQVTQRNLAQASHYFAALQTRLPLASRLQIEVGTSVADTLHNLVEQAEVDLVVLCAHGHSGQQQRPYGSIATSFLTYGTTPLLVMQDLPPHEILLSKAEQMAEEVSPRQHTHQGQMHDQWVRHNVAS